MHRKRGRRSLSQHALAIEISHDCPVAYVSTSYFGVQGGQNALVWDKGSLRFSPTTQRYDQVWPNSPISQDLRAIRVLARRIGKNELDTIQTCLAYVDAQREYAEKDRTGAGMNTYAQRIISQPERKDGLYWPTAQNEEQSPLGDLIAQATRQGYRVGAGRTPYHGYYYKILTKQGSSGEAGAFDYVVGGKMIGGFALVAYPAEYGNSGVRTFIVNHAGTIYQKDLGRARRELRNRCRRSILTKPGRRSPTPHLSSNAALRATLGSILYE